MVKNMDMDFIRIRMEIIIRDSLKMMLKMGKEKRILLMEGFLKELGKMGYLSKVCLNRRMVMFIKEILIIC